MLHGTETISQTPFYTIFVMGLKWHHIPIFLRIHFEREWCKRYIKPRTKTDPQWYLNVSIHYKITLLVYRVSLIILFYATTFSLPQLKSKDKSYLQNCHCLFVFIVGIAWGFFISRKLTVTFGLAAKFEILRSY